MDRWLNEHIEIELEKSRPKTLLEKILEDGYTKVDMNLRHFNVYEKGTKRILYNIAKQEIDTIYNAKKVFDRVNNIIRFEVKE